MSKDLAAWLAYIESLHPKSIAMGLDRIKCVMRYLDLQPTFPVITVAGTNGKGSTCALLEQIYHLAGFSVGCYTSPHLLRYNERVRINKHEVNDDALCAAFSAVETARAEANVSLTYFEVGTLTAVWHFMRSDIDVAILEIGMGGRLDAVNAFEPSCTIVTGVDLDHQDFLGDTREKIGYEKAGIYRSSVPAICGDDNPPASLLEYATKIHADFRCIHRDFDWVQSEKNGWCYQSHGQTQYRLPLPALRGRYQLSNAACAVAAVESLQEKLPVTEAVIADAMRQVALVGRFQSISKSPQVILDVAHNPQAARALAENLEADKSGVRGQTLAVFAMLADKDMQGVVDAIKHEIDVWYIAGIGHVRGASAADLVAIVAATVPGANIKTFVDVATAYCQACIDQGDNDRIVAFGSFFTVSGVMQQIQNALN